MKNTNISLLSSRALLLTATLALGGTLWVKPAFAATTNQTNLSVSTSVNVTCTITANAVAFPPYSPNGTDVIANGTVTTTCTNGSSATITLDQGQNAGTGSTDAAPLRRLSDAGTNKLSYSLFQNTDRTTVWGNTPGTGVNITGNGAAQNTTVYGKIPAGQNVPPGTYSDTVVATVTF